MEVWTDVSAVLREGDSVKRLALILPKHATDVLYYNVAYLSIYYSRAKCLDYMLRTFGRTLQEDIFATMPRIRHSTVNVLIAHGYKINGIVEIYAIGRCDLSR